MKVPDLFVGKRLFTGLGTPEILQEGTDVTLVTYGSCVRVAQEAIEILERHHISVELIDVQTLLPFDFLLCLQSRAFFTACLTNEMAPD